MRILLFLFASLQLAAQLTAFCFVFTVCESPPLNDVDGQWRAWAWLVASVGLGGALLALVHALFHSRWLQLPAALLCAAALVCSVPLGASSLELVASLKNRGGEDYAGLGGVGVALCGLGGAVIIGSLALVTLILLAAVKPPASASTPAY